MQRSSHRILTTHGGSLARTRCAHSAAAASGFAASAVRFNDTHPSVAWFKFAALAEGARLDTQQLW